MQFNKVVALVKAIHLQTKSIANEGLDRTNAINLFLRGDPGVAKSSAVMAAAAELGIPCRVVIASQYDPADLGGFPYRDGDDMYRARPFFLPSEGEGILFLDEISQCPVSVQNIVAQLVQDKRIGEHELAPGWTVVLAGNKQSNRAGTTVLVRQLTNRCAFVEVDVDPELWLAWAAETQADPMVQAYIAWRKTESLHKFDPAFEINATPRSWHKVSEVRKMKLEPMMEREVIRGLIGDAEATSFSGFIKLSDGIPDPARIIASPKTEPLPEKPEMIYATAAALVGHTTTRTLEPILTYLDRLTRKEFTVFYFRQVVANNPALKDHKVAVAWKVKNQKILL